MQISLGHMLWLVTDILYFAFKQSDIGGGGFWLSYNTILANSCGCQGSKIVFEFIADVFEQLCIKSVQLLVTVPTLLKKLINASIYQLLYHNLKCL